VHLDVAERALGGDVGERAVGPGRCEVDDAVVVDAQAGDDLLQAGAALERELDLDRNSLAGVEDGVGEVGLRSPVGAGAGAEAARERAFAFPLAETELVFEQEANVGDGFEVGDEAVVGLPGAKARAGDARAAAREPDERR
jgi:hypothetical protein